MRIRGLAIFAAVALGACNGGMMNPATGGDAGTGPSVDGGNAVDAAPDLDNGQPSTMYPAPHPDPPQVVSGGGPVLAAPVIVPIFFSNDDATQKASIEDFESKVGSSTYWTAATMEYGVGAATSATPVELTETATGTIDDSAIQTWLAGKLNANDPAFPAPTANSVYVIHYPAGVTITLSMGGQTAQSCNEFGGYHQNITLDANHGSAQVAYAVIPRCTSGFGGLDTLDTATGAESHEIIEAATDPYPTSPLTTGYAEVDSDHLYWMFGLGGGEVGDMCAQDPNAFTKFTGLDYVVQRIWSNAAAKAGHDPCVPALPNEVYFNAVPELNDTVTLGGGQYTMKGVSVPVGMSKTIDLDLFSDGDTGGPWTVKAEDFNQLMGGTSNLQLSLDRSQGQNGEKLHLTIKTMAASQYGADIFIVLSKLGNNEHFWLGLVGEQ